MKEKFSPTKTFFSIKTKILIACVIFLAVPTIVLGTLAYNIYQNSTFKNLTQQLRLMTRNWSSTTEVYIEQIDRILRREEVLIEKRLSSIAKTIKQDFLFYVNDENPDEIESFLNHISKIKIGYGGDVFVMSREGDFLLINDPAYKDKNFFSLVGQFNNKNRSIDEFYQKLKMIDFNDSVEIHYLWKGSEQKASRLRITSFIYFEKWNAIIGVSLNYTDFKSNKVAYLLKEELKQKISNQIIGNKGYVWVINSQGDFIVSRHRLRDGENILDVPKSDRTLFIQDIIKQAKNLKNKNKNEKEFIAEYDWKALGDDKFLKHITAFSYVEKWDWIIGVSAYEEDFFKGLESIKASIFWVGRVAIILGAFIAYLFAAYLTYAIRRLEELSIQASKGDLQIKIDENILKKKDEIGNLANSFQVMIETLKGKIYQQERNQSELEEALRISKIMHQQLTDAQDKFIQTEKMASIGHLAAGVAHEINNPLGYIASNVESLEKYLAKYDEVLGELNSLMDEKFDKDQPSEIKEKFYAIHKKMHDINFNFIRNDVAQLINESKSGVDQIQNIVSDLRDFSAKGDQEFVPLNIEQVVDSLLNIMRNEIKYSIKVIKEYGKVSSIMGIEQHVGQIFVNIIFNAAQAIEEKGTIKIKTWEKAEQVFISVEDDGCGISPENRDKIFDAFFTTKPVGKGIGLGLSLSYELIKKHHGDISVESEIGVGTTFTLVFPAVKKS